MGGSGWVCAVTTCEATVGNGGPEVGAGGTPDTGTDTDGAGACAAGGAVGDNCVGVSGCPGVEPTATGVEACGIGC